MLSIYSGYAFLLANMFHVLSYLIFDLKLTFTVNANENMYIVNISY